MIVLFVYIKYILSCLLIVSVAPLYLAIWIFLQLVLFIYGASELALIVDEFMYASYERYVLFFIEILSGTKVILYGDFKQALNKRESVILFGNHQCSMDWIVVAMLAERCGTGGFVKFILKKSLKYIPLYGYYFKQHGYIYVERSGNFKLDQFEKQVNELSTNPHPMWLTLFPEGHRYNPENTANIELMKKFASNNSLPVFRHMYTPRTKALFVCAEQLVEKVDAVYNITIAFSSTLAPPSDKKNRYTGPTYYRLFRQSVTVHIHISRIPMAEVVSAEDFDDWLYSQFKQKDELLETFYSKDPATRGTFGPNGKASKISTSKAILTAAIYLLGIVPLVYFELTFKPYLLMSAGLAVATLAYSAILY